MDFKNIDIDDRLNIAYNFFYKNNDQDFQIGDYNTNDFKNIDNIKLITNSTNVKSIINNIFNVDINFINHINDKYIFERINGIHKSEIILSLYPDKNDIDNPDDECNKNELVKLMLSEFLIKKKTIHIIIPIINFDLPIEELTIFFNKYHKLKELSKLKKKIIKINIVEKFYDKTTLDKSLTNDFLKNWNVNDLFYLIFQVIHTLYIIRSKYSKFKHNNLSINNIDVYISKRNIDDLKIYSINNKEYKFYNNGLIVKLNNFDKVSFDDNDNNDILFFLNSLLEHFKRFNNQDYNKFINFIIECINIKDPLLIMAHDSNGNSLEKKNKNTVGYRMLNKQNKKQSKKKQQSRKQRKEHSKKRTSKESRSKRKESRLKNKSSNNKKEKINSIAEIDFLKDGLHETHPGFTQNGFNQNGFSNNPFNYQGVGQNNYNYNGFNHTNQLNTNMMNNNMGNSYDTTQPQYNNNIMSYIPQNSIQENNQQPEKIHEQINNNLLNEQQTGGGKKRIQKGGSFFF